MSSVLNAAAEIDLCRHVSFNLPVYYCAWNYGTSRVKFRTFAIQPELRYWSGEDNESLYWGLHGGLAYYNLAFGGEYRYQDHAGTSPALGCGLSIGYRLPLGEDKRLKLELSIGVGMYSLYYDKFRNYRNGPLYSVVKETYVGLDQASVSFSYSFGLKRKGGGR